MAHQWPHTLGTACTRRVHPLDENQMSLVGVLKCLLRNIINGRGALHDVDHSEEDAAECKERSRLDVEQCFRLTTYLIKFGHFTLWRPSADADLLVKCQTLEDDYDDPRRVRLTTLA